MKCPYCGHLGDKVVDSRESKEGEVIRRRRECLGCGKRFTSYERIAGTVRSSEADWWFAQGVRKAAGESCGGRGDRGSRRVGVAGTARARNQHGGNWRLRDGGAESARQGRLRPFRVGVSPLPRHRRIHERAQGLAECKGV